MRKEATHQGSSALDEQEALARLRLIRSERIGPVTFRDLLHHYKSGAAALEALPELARQGGAKKPPKICSPATAKAEMAQVEKLGGQLLHWGQAPYPSLLGAIDDAPPVLCVLGHSHLLSKPALAIVGARNASANARRLARTFAHQAGSAGYLVVSGLARGIDAAAHEGALESGTLAVMAGGLDVIYPAENEKLYHQIAAQGLLVSELPPGIQPQARHFPRRNRIISGLSLGSLIIEAALKSGSLITARFAGEQGREVMAIPGSPLDPRARGANKLIKEGAALIEAFEDVLDALKGQSPPGIAEPQGDLFADQRPLQTDKSELELCRKRLGELLGAEAVGVDELVRQCQLSPAVINLVLLEWELAGRIDRHAGNRISLVLNA